MQFSQADIAVFLDSTAFLFGNRPVSFGQVLLGAGAFVLLMVLLRFWLAIRAGQRQAADVAAAAERAHEAEARMAELIATQNALAGRMQTMSEIFASRQGDMMRLVDERLANMTGRLGQSLTETTKSTQESLAKLQERLAVIDTAQNNIQSLTGQVVQLQNILANKQTRGAFGEARMAAIVADGLPQGAYQFQATLSNQARPDCLVFMPNDTPPLVIDAKFPLES